MVTNRNVCLSMDSLSNHKFLGTMHKCFLYTIIFINGFKLILPIDISDDARDIAVSLPIWATNFEIHGVFLSDFLFIIYFLVFGIRFHKQIFKGKIAMLFFYLFVGLFMAGVFSTLVNLEIFSDYLEATRLVTLGLFFVCLVWWTDLLGEITVLRIFIIGLIVSGVINLYFTFFFSLRLQGGLPQLLGQNGPGGSAGFLVFVGAWFFIISKKMTDKLLSLIFLVLFVFILIISFSKLGMLMGACGIVIFIAAFFVTSSFKVLRNRMLILTLVIFSFIFWLTQSEKGLILIEGTSTFFYYKLGNDEAGFVEKQGGDQERVYYFWGVGEVFINNPILGVGYNGFGPAVSKTKAHSSGRMSDEDSFVNANPHNAFLYYISANGIIGWIMIGMMYLTFLFVFYKIFVPLGISGIIIFFFIMLASLIHTNTLMSFFNTTIMYLPTAIAVSTLQRRINFKRLNKTQSLTV